MKNLILLLILILAIAATLSACSSLDGYTLASRNCYTDSRGNQYCISSEGKRIYVQANFKSSPPNGPDTLRRVDSKGNPNFGPK